VYLVNVRLKERKFFGLCNIGKRPTIGGTDLVTEVHILEFCEDIYGKEISIKVIRAIRKEKKFQNLDMLVNQINLDKEKAMRMLSALNKDQTG
jgi:riboflavin kinase/FMN adenylyltransferase